MILRAHTGVSGADFVEFMLDIEQQLRAAPNSSIRIRLADVEELETAGVLVEGEVPDLGMNAFVFEEVV